MKYVIYSMLACLSLCFSGSMLSAQSSPLSAKIDAYVVTTASDGSERLQVAEVANPGDVILYRAVFENTTSEPLEDLKPVVPVPVALDYIVDSVKPLPVEGSLDGVTFQAYPIKDASGAPVDAASYRAFRWSLSELEAGVPFTAEIRASLAP